MKRRRNEGVHRFEPNDEQRKMVKGMAALGIPRRDIGYVIVSEDTVEKYFLEELNVGPAEANARIGQFSIGRRRRISQRLFSGRKLAWGGVGEPAYRAYGCGWGIASSENHSR